MGRVDCKLRLAPSLCCVLANLVSKMARFSFHPAATSALYWGLPMSGFATARQKMVDGQVRPSDVTDIRILDAMLAVPREAFVPESLLVRTYLDLYMDISDGASAKRFLIRPAVTAKMLQAAEIKDTDKVLV